MLTIIVSVPPMMSFRSVCPRKSSCAVAEAPKRRKTTLPVTAVEVRCRDCPMKLGATAEYRPQIAKPVTAPGEAAKKMLLDSGGIPGSCRRTAAGLPRVRSRTSSRAAPAMTSVIALTRKGVNRGPEANRARSPDIMMPSPSPPMFAAVARDPASRSRPGGAFSSTVTVAVEVKIPAASPDRTRPTSSRPTFDPMRNSTAEAIEKTTPAASTGRRPSPSERRPKSTSAAMTPRA